ncbi:MAG: signal peptidase II [Candidatus Woesearchaeota archaeon]
MSAKQTKKLNKKVLNLLILSSFLILLLDQLLKQIFIKQGKYLLNKNFVYGLSIGFLNPTITVTVVFLFILSTTIFGILKKNEFVFFIFPTIVSISNVLDRLIYDGVIDYIYIPIFPFNILFSHFNLADASISIFILIFIIFQYKK